MKISRKTAKLISSAILTRCVAEQCVSRLVNSGEAKDVASVGFWMKEHDTASRELMALGIEVSLYNAG